MAGVMMGDTGKLCGAAPRDHGGGGIRDSQKAGLAKDARAATSILPSRTDRVARSSSPPASPEAGQLSQSTRPLALNGPAKLSPRKRAVHSRSVNVFGSGN